MVGEEVKRFPAGVVLRRERPRDDGLISLTGTIHVAEKGEFNHTDLRNLTQT